MHTHIFFKEDTTKPIVWKEKKSPHPGEARRDEAPVSSVVPATTEKHQETTTQLSTPSLFNYCHIITAIYLHLLHSHQTNTHRGTGARTEAVSPHKRQQRHSRITKTDQTGFILHIINVKLIWRHPQANQHQTDTEDDGREQFKWNAYSLNMWWTATALPNMSITVLPPL